ncbi:MAG: hypothetical protein L0Z53_05110 [Acidobacteriales bacterium]|nr:hypothetical protein [Terriglobales bacterium]
MKGRIAKLVVFVLLGAIGNVAVAWGCWLHEHEAMARILRTPVSRTVQYRAPVMLLPSRSEAKTIAIDMRLPTRSGWPCSCLAAFVMEYHNGKFVRTSGIWQAGIQVPARSFGLTGDNLTLPVQPTWPGFVINTLFYAAILWLLFAAPFALRRWRRIKRGLCPACAYPVGESAACTECGKPVAPRCVAVIGESGHV